MEEGKQSNEEKSSEHKHAKKKNPRGPTEKSFALPEGLKGKKTIRPQTPGHYHLFRKNLATFQEAFDNHQYDFGADDIKKEDIEINHEVEINLMHMRTNWGDGTGGESEELLCETDSPSMHGRTTPVAAKMSGRSKLDQYRVSASRKTQHYVESATGFFKLVNNSRSLRRRESRSASSEDVYAKYYRAKAALQPMEKTLWLFAQGLFAGFSSTPVILQWCTTTDFQFISSYRRSSSSLRRILFLLGLFAVAGALDTLKKAAKTPIDESNARGEAQRRWKDRSKEERVLLWVAALVYLTALSASLFCSVGDTIITLKDNFDYTSENARDGTDNWKSYALDVDGQRFKSILHQWYNSNTLRFTCALIGWVVVTRLHFLAIVDRSSHATVEMLTKKLASQTEMYRKMKGDSALLSNMTLPEIRRLHEEQQRVADVTKLLLGAEMNSSL